MVPSRSRKTAARKPEGSGTLGLRGLEPGLAGSLHHVRRDIPHAAMVDRTMAKKARAAIRLLLNDGRARSHRSRALRVGRAKHCDDRQAYRGGNVHRPRIIADEEMTLAEQRREIGDRRFLREVDGRSVYFLQDRTGNGAYAIPPHTLYRS